MKTLPAVTEWQKPQLEEIPLSSEVTSYSLAELPEDEGSPLL